MGAISTLIWFVAVLVGIAAALVFLFLFLRMRYLREGQEKGE